MGYKRLSHCAQTTHAVIEFAATAVDELTKYVTLHPLAAGNESFSATPVDAVSSPPPPTAVPLGQVTDTVAELPGVVGPVAELLVVVNVRCAPCEP